MDPGVSLPSLREFLRITQLLSYEGKLKKLKCCEVLDILKVLGQVGMRSIEEQRVRRYLNHFQTKSLTEQESMEQPVLFGRFLSNSISTRNIEGCTKTRNC